MSTPVSPGSPPLPTTSTPPEPGPAELTPSARIGAVLFRYRTWFPVLFLAIPFFAPGHTTPASWIAGTILVLIGEAFRLAGVAAAGTETRRRSREVYGGLVTHGVFAWSRNPLYNGNFLVWIGFVVIANALWFLPAAVLFFAIEYSFIVRYEEGVLESTFGRQYQDYRNRTPRWLPSKPEDPPSGTHNWRAAWRSEISTFMQYAGLAILLILKDIYM